MSFKEGSAEFIFTEVLVTVHDGGAVKAAGA